MSEENKTPPNENEENKEQTVSPGNEGGETGAKFDLDNLKQRFNDSAIGKKLTEIRHSTALLDAFYEQTQKYTLDRKSMGVLPITVRAKCNPTDKTIVFLKTEDIKPGDLLTDKKLNLAFLVTAVDPVPFLYPIGEESVLCSNGSIITPDEFPRTENPNQQSPADAAAEKAARQAGQLNALESGIAALGRKGKDAAKRFKDFKGCVLSGKTNEALRAKLIKALADYPDLASIVLQLMP